jgi:predicted nuclease with TOPRIM domain
VETRLNELDNRIKNVEKLAERFDEKIDNVFSKFNALTEKLSKIAEDIVKINTSFELTKISSVNDRFNIIEKSIESTRTFAENNFSRIQNEILNQKSKRLTYFQYLILPLIVTLIGGSISGTIISLLNNMK